MLRDGIAKSLINGPQGKISKGKQAQLTLHEFLESFKPSHFKDSRLEAFAVQYMHKLLS